MKFSFLVLLLAFSLWATGQQFGTLYVAAKSGLSLREKPDPGSKIMEKIPYGTKVTLLSAEEERIETTAEGMKGFWGKVKFNNKTGYLVDAYLLPWQPPKLSAIKEMNQYLAQVTVPFGAKLQLQQGNMNNIAEGGWKLSKQLYKNGAEWHHHSGYEYGSDTYFFPGFSLEQGFLLLRLIPEFKLVFDPADEFPHADKTIRRGEGECTIKVEKETMGDYSWISRIKVEYAEGAYYTFEMFLAGGQLVVSFAGGL